MSDSVQPHRPQPTNLPCPWDSLGKNTGVGCHCLLQCMKVKSESEVTQSCPTPRDPMDCSPPGSSVHGNFQARVLEWGAVAFSQFYLRLSLFLVILYSHFHGTLTSIKSPFLLKSSTSLPSYLHCTYHKPFLLLYGESKSH